MQENLMNTKNRGLCQRRSRLRIQSLEKRHLMTAVLGDFNGDGWNDLATGVPHEAIGDAKDAEAVLVQYGTGVGLFGSSEVWNAGNVNGLNLEAGDRFGAALTVGDFDGNGVDDLAIGIPDRDLAGIRDSGVVAVVYGYQRSVIQNGLSPYDTQLFMQGIDGIANQPEMMDRFGSVLAAGDFDGDGRDDLVVGVPNESFVIRKNPEYITIEDAGAVHVINGSSSGLSAQQSQFWHQGLVGVWGTRGRYDQFGAAFAVGNFDGRGNDDLAIGVPGESELFFLDSMGVSQTRIVARAGATQVLYSNGGRGLNRSSNELLNQSATAGPEGLGSLEDRAEPYGYFGSALAAADFNLDGSDDLAIGVPGEDGRKGAVHVVFAERGRGGYGLSLHDDVVLRKTDVVTDCLRRYRCSLHGDLFGHALANRVPAAGQPPEPVIGIPGDSNHVAYAGSVVVVSNIWSHAYSGVDLQARRFREQSGGEIRAAYGSSLVVGQINAAVDARLHGDTEMQDIIIGVPGDSVRGLERAGFLRLVYAVQPDALGLSNRPLLLSQRAFSGVSVEAGDQFGGAIPNELLASSGSEEAVSDLQSNSGARKTIYLDFNGHATGHWLPRRRHRSPGFTLDRPESREDDAYSRINRTEAAMIEHVWVTVAEDFAAFDVNVTTRRPENGNFDRVAIGGEQPPWLDSALGGHRSYDNDVAWVWPESFRAYNPTASNLRNQQDFAVLVGNVASHEQGHELGLDHKSESGTRLLTTGESVNFRKEYSDDDSDWNPIMGDCLNSQCTIWTQRSRQLDDRTTLTNPEAAIRIGGEDEVTFLNRVLGLQPDDHNGRGHADDILVR
jgi:hypothetical protein